MVRPVEGFQADDGTFFPSEEAAESYEAHRDLYEALDMKRRTYNVELGSAGNRYLIHSAMDYVVLMFSIIERYVKTNPTDKTKANDINEPPDLGTKLASVVDNGTTLDTDEPELVEQSELWQPPNALVSEPTKLDPDEE